MEADRRRCDEKLVTVLLVVSLGVSRLLSVTARPQMMGPRMLTVLLLLPCVAAFSVQRAALLENIAPLNRGFSMSKEQKKAVTAAIDALAAAAPQADAGFSGRPAGLY